MGDDERARRLLSDLSIALRKDPLIDEFGFMFCPEPVCNKSPIVLEQHKIGIETWSIKILYLFVHQQLLKVKPISNDSRFLNDCSQAAVLLNAECSTAWNIRKRLVLKKAVGGEADLKLATLVLTKHPKSAETFAQRRWLLQHIIPAIKPSHSFHESSASTNQYYNPHQNQYDPSPPPNGLDRLVNVQQNGAAGNLDRIIDGELKACTIAADRYPNNYNAWSHRIWVLKHLARGGSQVVKSEWASSKDWVRRHISDHSGFHYRQFLMQTLRKGACGTISPLEKENGSHAMGLVEEELQFTANLISFYPGHEAIWYHRRFVIHFWRTILTGKPNATTNSTEPLSHDDITVLEDLTAQDASVALTPPSWQETLPSSTGSVSTACCNDEAQMETDQVPAKQSFLCPDHLERGKSLEDDLAAITTSEIQFADAVNACTPHGDVASQTRCVEGYKRWLKSQ